MERQERGALSCATSYISHLTSDICLRSLKLLVHFYRNTIGLVLPNSCRYHPTCSQYALDALNEHGAAKGAWMALKRIARCHPLAAGGYDPVPTKGQRTKDEEQVRDFSIARRTKAA